MTQFVLAKTYAENGHWENLGDVLRYFWTEANSAGDSFIRPAICSINCRPFSLWVSSAFDTELTFYMLTGILGFDDGYTNGASMMVTNGASSILITKVWPVIDVEKNIYVGTYHEIPRYKV